MVFHLSVVILSFNTKELIQRCLVSLEDAIQNQKGCLIMEVIVLDNNSTDGSVDFLKNWEHEQLSYKKIVIFEKKNLGFSAGCNKAVRLATGNFLLFLNSDVMIPADFFFYSLCESLYNDPNAAGLTVRVVRDNGLLDQACHRGFPTIWRSLTYFSGLERLSQKFAVGKKIFGGYHLTDKNMKIRHIIDSPSGAFFLMKKEIFIELGGFDEDFFMYGEDIDLAYRINKLKKNIYYDPSVSVVHVKYQSGLKKKDKVQTKTVSYFYEAMRIFFRKHYEKKTPFFLRKLVYLIISLKEMFA